MSPIMRHQLTVIKSHLNLYIQTHILTLLFLIISGMILSKTQKVLPETLPKANLHYKKERCV